MLVGVKECGMEEVMHASSLLEALLSMLERVEGIRSKIAGIGDQEAVSLSTRCRAFLMRGISSLTVFHITVASTPK